MTAGRKLCLNGCFQVLPISEFGRHPRSPDGLMARCKKCELERLQRQRHGITARQKRLLASWQGGCRICGRAEPGGHGWVVDHDHSCCPGDQSCEACRRGVICPRCNTALGYAQDSPELLRKMADYLESGERLSPPSQFTDRWTDWVKPVARTNEDHLLTQKSSTTSDNLRSVSRAGGLRDSSRLSTNGGADAPASRPGDDTEATA